jgi:hypothetical protein
VGSNELYGTFPNVIAFLSPAGSFNISAGKKRLKGKAVSKSELELPCLWKKLNMYCYSV